jgi:phosphatidylglycerol:prolipoprotein diacylglycerol transferase
MPFALLPFPQIDPVALSLGPFFGFGPLQIRWYALAYIAGILVGWWLARRLIARDDLWDDRPRPTAPELDDFITWITLGIIIGGRLGYVLFYDFSHYVSNPVEIFTLWHGGMSFHGGMLGPLIVMVLYSRGKPYPALTLIDIVACVAPVGLFFGRLANFINGELWGRVTTSPFGMIFPLAGPDPRYPSQLYEAALEGIILFLVLRILTHGFRLLRYPGAVAGTFGIGYGLARFIVEYFREPDAHLGYLTGGLTMGQILSLPTVIAGIALLFVAAHRARRE